MRKTIAAIPVIFPLLAVADDFRARSTDPVDDDDG